MSPPVPCERAPDPPCVDISGDVDAATAETWKRAGLQLIEAHDASPVLLDLGAVSFIDSTGLSMLLAIRNAAMTSGRAMRLVNVPNHVRRLFAITGLTDVLTPEDPP